MWPEHRRTGPDLRGRDSLSPGLLLSQSGSATSTGYRSEKAGHHLAGSPFYPAALVVQAAELPPAPLEGCYLPSPTLSSLSRTHQSGHCHCRRQSVERCVPCHQLHRDPRHLPAAAALTPPRQREAGGESDSVS